MGTYRFEIHVAAPPERVFDTWVDPGRLGDWVEGVKKVTDLSGPPDRAGTRYTVWFGRMRSPTEVLEAERPRLVRTRFGNLVLRGENRVSLEPDGNGTRLVQELRTQGVIPALSARIFATGSYKGSFRGELAAFARLVEREAAEDDAPPPG